MGVDDDFDDVADGDIDEDSAPPTKSTLKVISPPKKKSSLFASHETTEPPAPAASSSSSQPPSSSAFSPASSSTARKPSFAFIEPVEDTSHSLKSDFDDGEMTKPPAPFSTSCFLPRDTPQPNTPLDLGSKRPGRISLAVKSWAEEIGRRSPLLYYLTERPRAGYIAIGFLVPLGYEVDMDTRHPERVRLIFKFSAPVAHTGRWHAEVGTAMRAPDDTHSAFPTILSPKFSHEIFIACPPGANLEDVPQLLICGVMASVVFTLVA